MASSILRIVALVLSAIPETFSELVSMPAAVAAIAAIYPLTSDAASPSRFISSRMVLLPWLISADPERT